MTEELTGILRAVRQQTAVKTATGYELGKLLSQNELHRSACQPRPIRPNDSVGIGGTAIRRHAVVGNENTAAHESFSLRRIRLRTRS
jgi:hypothetical protein